MPCIPYFVKANVPRAREHVTWHIYQYSETYRLEHHIQERGVNHSNLRWVVDTDEDYEFIHKMYDALYPENPLFDRHAVIALLKRRPELMEINSKIEQKIV